ncbi:hypothetical protein ACFLKB_12240 [Clostridium sp. FAM 1755]|uniref:hypothetical protein n=1 Tax=Clostridium TaxID=1485 RepID=UPI0006ABB396|nr:hypothetical protein [Clostridium botulinum]KOR26657.1 hypothetical protein ND00_05360 [Clostridium sp. L74]
MKKLNMHKFIFIINLLILPIIILFNINLNNKSTLIKEEKNNLLTKVENSNTTKNIDCAYILEKLSEKPYVSVKSIEDEKNNIYVNLKYYGNKEELKEFFNSVNSSKHFKSIKNLSINNTKIENNIDESDKKDSSINDNEEKQIDITLEYSKNLN